MLKTGCFILEGLNSFAMVFYTWYFFFFMQKVHSFGNQANLALASVFGLIYMFGSWWGGRFAQRFGYFTALKLGFVIIIVALAFGTQVISALAQILIMAAVVLGMCFLWPTLEALVSEGETPVGIQRMVGIYNIVWAGTGALAYFTGGAILDNLGFPSLFYVPVAIVLVQLGLTLWLEAKARRAPSSAQTQPLLLKQLNPRPIAKAKTFLRLAWLANPFAYVAVNTLIPLIPEIARRFELSTMLAGFCCSIWCFARVGVFFALCFWDGWHYRFRWLLGAFLGMIGAFAIILVVPSLAVLVGAQIVFGAALGLIYASSLFYSMDTSETKGTHGGIHEAAIGLGNFAGPAVGALSLHFWPNHANSGAIAVTALLIVGLAGLVGIWRSGNKAIKKSDE